MMRRPDIEGITRRKFRWAWQATDDIDALLAYALSLETAIRRAEDRAEIAEIALEDAKEEHQRELQRLREARDQLAVWANDALRRIADENDPLLGIGSEAQIVSAQKDPPP